MPAVLDARLHFNRVLAHAKWVEMKTNACSPVQPVTFYVCARVAGSTQTVATTLTGMSTFRDGSVALGMQPAIARFECHALLHLLH